MNPKLLLIVGLGLANGAGLIAVRQCRPAKAKPAGPFVVPEELLYKRSTFPDEENAILDWIKANEARTNLSASVKEGLQIAWNPSAPEPDEKTLAAIHAAIRQNEPALTLLERSLAKPKAQWPDRDALDEEPALPVLAELMRLRLFEAYEMRKSGGRDKAAGHLADSLRLAQTAVDSEGAVIHYLIGHAVRRMTEQAIQSYAVRPGTPEDQLAFLLDRLPPLDTETASYLQCLRVEFAYYVNKEFDPVKLARQWTEPVGKDPTVYLTLVPENLHQAFRVFLTPDLVGGHPAPVDHVAAKIKSAARFLRYIRNAHARWDEQESSSEDLEEIETTFLKDAGKILKIVADEPLPLSSNAVAKVRSAYNRFENPVGRLLEAKGFPLDVSTKRVFQARTEREATRTVIGLQIFLRRRGGLPDSLEQLVSEGILPAVPKDEFASKPLRYSKERGIIWSVGPDGRDDGGKGTPGKLYAVPDIVWSVAVHEQ